MNVRFAGRTLQIDDARICYRNFKGLPSDFNAAGNRNFSVIIPDQETADALMNDTNQYGIGWNVKISTPREEGDQPFIHLPIKVKFNDRGPAIYLKSGAKTIKLEEETVGMLDDIDIRSVDLDIRPYDGEGRFGAFRSAYLSAIWVTQEVDRFAARMAEEECPFED